MQRKLTAVSMFLGLSFLLLLPGLAAGKVPDSYNNPIPERVAPLAPAASLQYAVTPGDAAAKPAAAQSVSAAAFTEQSAILPGLPGLRESSAVWGDFDNDGLLDLFIDGCMSSYCASSSSKLYLNISTPGSPRFSDVSAALPGLPNLGDGAANWVDYDNDGKIDLFIAGYNGSYISKLYRNISTLGVPAFTDVSSGLPGGLGPRYSTAAWGDADGDGKRDLFIAGFDNGYYISKLYRNTSSGATPSFSDVTGSLPGLPNFIAGTASWGDFDSDGRLDLFVAGASGSYMSKLYRNTSSGSSINFSDVTASLPGVPGLVYSASAWGDIDNDGKIDLYIQGRNSAGVSVSKLYQNTSTPGSPSFTDVTGVFPGVDEGTAVWGDYDNDGKLDFFVSGYATNYSSKLYRNTSTIGSFSFSDASGELPGLQTVLYGASAWGDYDGDGKLDLFMDGYNGYNPISRLYHNESVTANTPPTAPGNLTIVATRPTTATLSWSMGNDTQTPAAGLSYNLRVGTTPGGQDVLAPMALTVLSDGLRLVAALGPQQALTYTLTGLTPNSTYYWSVQAIDTAFAGSTFGVEQMFTTPPLDTATPTATRTATLVPTATRTRTATRTATLIPTATRTRTPRPTNTPTKTVTSPPTQTATWTPTATETLEPTETSTAVPTDTATTTSVPTETETANPTDTATATATAVPTDTATATVTDTTVPTDTATATATHTATTTATVTATDTATAIDTETATTTSTPIPDTETATATTTGTATETNTATVTETGTATSTTAPSSTATRTATITGTSTAVPTVPTTNTATATAIATNTATASVSSTRTATATASVPSTATITRTSTASITATRTVTAVATATRTNTATATASTTRTSTATPIPTVENVVWSDSVSVIVVGNTITNTLTVDSWGAGSISNRGIAGGDGYVEARGPSTNTTLMFGLGIGNDDQSHVDIDFGFYVTGGTYYIVRQGGPVAGFAAATYKPGDTFRAAVRGTNVDYYRTDKDSGQRTLVYSDANVITPASYPLRLDTALYSARAVLMGAVISGNLINVAPRGVVSPPSSCYPVAWNAARAVGVSYSSGVITKTNAIGWTAGDISIKAIAGPPSSVLRGAVQAQIASVNDYVSFGLSFGGGTNYSDANASYTDIDYAFYVYPPTKLLQARYRGSLLKSVGEYNANDVLRVEFDGYKVKFYRNGIPVYVAGFTLGSADYPAVLDTSLYNSGATLRQVSICGSSVADLPAGQSVAQAEQPEMPTATAVAASFNDVQPGDYFYESVRYLSSRGVVSGYADNTFRPHALTTRGQLAKIVVLATGTELERPATATFSDIPTTDAFFPYIETAVALRMVNGYADGMFRPFAGATRGQLAKMVVLGLTMPLAEAGEARFSDVPVNNAFYQYVETAYQAGLLGGYSDGSFRPDAGATRSQIAKIIYSALGR